MKWGIIDIGDLSEIYSGYAFKSSEMVSIQESNSFPVIKIKNVNNRIVTKECDSFLPESVLKTNYSKYELKKDDILVAMTV